MSINAELAATAMDGRVQVFHKPSRYVPPYFVAVDGMVVGRGPGFSYFDTVELALDAGKDRAKQKSEGPTTLPPPKPAANPPMARERSCTSMTGSTTS